MLIWLITCSILFGISLSDATSCQSSVVNNFESVKNELCSLEIEFDRLTEQIQSTAWTLLSIKRSIGRMKSSSNIVTHDCGTPSQTPDCTAVLDNNNKESNNSCTSMNMADLLAQYFAEHPNVEIKFSNGSSLINRCNGTMNNETNETGYYTSIKSCRDVKKSGKYLMKLDSVDEGFPVFCDAEYEGGGWVVIQHRFNGFVDFYRNWAEYTRGFGEFDSEFWLGNDKIHRLTAAKPRELHFVLTNWENITATAKYPSFQIGNDAEQYVLKSLGTYSGTAGDSLTRGLNSKFTTSDRDNDSSNVNCAVAYHGAWWYENCHLSNLNGKYVKGTTSEYATSMCWNTWTGYYYGLKTSKVLVRI